uniref:Protein Mpv17 n=3 Tax=Aegilops tauschii subsp. strangulata TaxID=200361 RepID=A0A453KBG6_AEGTS
MAMASALPLLLVPRPIVSPRPAAAGRFLSLSAPLSTAAPAPAPVEPLKGGGRLARLQTLHAASCCNSAPAAASGGVEAARAKGLQLVAWYLLSLDKHPVATKAVTSAVLTLAGDLICQLVIDKVPELDLKRTFVFTLLGLVLVGPTLHFWYLYLSKLVTISGTSGVISRLLLDQFIFSPVFIGVFMSLLVTLEGKPSLVVPKLKQVKRISTLSKPFPDTVYVPFTDEEHLQLLQEWFSSLIANWQLWIPFQFLNFYFVPQKLQVLAANFVALAWNVILSYKAHKKVIAE